MTLEEVPPLFPEIDKVVVLDVVPTIKKKKIFSLHFFSVQGFPLLKGDTKDVSFSGCTSANSFFSNWYEAYTILWYANFSPTHTMEESSSLISKVHMETSDTLSGSFKGVKT